MTDVEIGFLVYVAVVVAALSGLYAWVERGGRR